MSATFADPQWLYVGGAYGVAAVGFIALAAAIIGRLTRWAGAVRADTDET